MSDEDESRFCPYCGVPLIWKIFHFQSGKSPVLAAYPNKTSRQIFTERNMGTIISGLYRARDGWKYLTDGNFRII